MSNVRIVQLLCPSRHCVVATAYESPDGTEMPEIADLLLANFEVYVKAGANPWCGICSSRDLHPEDRLTVFESMDEAVPHLRESERQQAAVRAYFKASKG